MKNQGSRIYRIQTKETTMHFPKTKCKVLRKLGAGICFGLAVLCFCTPAFAGMQRWTFCMVDSSNPSEAWASPVFRYDFGTGYQGDPEVYGRLVNRFFGAVKEQYSVNGRSLNSAVCYRPDKDLSRDEVEAQRASDMQRFRRTHRVDFP
jgi:hypothetical protein